MRILFLLFLISSGVSLSQNVQHIIDQVDTNRITTRLQEFAGEVPTTVNGNAQIIINRESNQNDIAKDYLVERLNALPNLNVTTINYSTRGTNIIATQTGLTNPNDIYIICAHYDTVTNYCVDDNATGTIAVLEIAELLSQQCTDNTIVYAFWDEEEQGLIGARNYAQAAKARNDNIKAVLNLDMIGYDGDGDNDFDIDVRDVANSLAMKDDIVQILNQYGTNWNLNANVINPGTPLSDHKVFWDENYTALLIGEAWSMNDQNNQYHTTRDRFNNLDLSYCTDIIKLCTAFMATKAGLNYIDSSIQNTGSSLTVTNDPTATYRWIDCSTNLSISGATSHSYTTITDGTYKVSITKSGCTEESDCINFTTLSQNSLKTPIQVSYNQSTKDLLVTNTTKAEIQLRLYHVNGQFAHEWIIEKAQENINLKNYSAGIYILQYFVEGQRHILKIQI